MKNQTSHNRPRKHGPCMMAHTLAYALLLLALFLSTGTAKVTATDPPPAQIQFSASSFFGDEGNTAIITVTRTVSTETTVTVNYSTSDGTAQAGSDYTAASGTLTFLPGEVSKTFLVQTTGDVLDEDDEYINLTLSNPSSNAVLGVRSTAFLTIIDGPALLPDLIVEGVTVTEGQQGTTTDAVFNVKLTRATQREVRVNYHTGDDTTEPGSDYVETNGLLIFNPGETVKTVTVTVNGDNVYEANEYFYVHIIYPVNAYIAQAQASGIIVNDDAPPSLSIDDAAIAEGNGGFTNAQFTVHLNGLSEVPASVHYGTIEYTATSSDYNNVSGIINFNAGETTKTILVPIKGDILNEPDEIFFVNLSQPLNATIGDGQAVGTILNDDNMPTLKFMAPFYSATEDAGLVSITVIRIGDTNVPVTVDYTTADNSAQQRTDYFTSSGTLSFAAGETSKSFNIMLQDDAYVEGDEFVNISLSNPSAGAALDSAHTVFLVIHDNDSQTPTTNPIDDAPYFVRQQYMDFLNRLPDTGGLNYWTNQITLCGADAQCIHDRRIAVADAFSFETEFQETGAYIYRIYKVSIGLSPTYSQFTAERGRVVSGPGVDQSKNAYALHFVQTASFQQEYAMDATADQFVDRMLTVVKNYSGVDLSSQRGTLIGLYDGTDVGKAAILRQVADNQAVVDAEYNRAFVLMEYFGYLHRNPDAGGYAFWLSQVNKFPLRDVGIQHAIVCSFITSAEYQTRFSPVVAHTNRECPQ